MATLQRGEDELTPISCLLGARFMRSQVDRFDIRTDNGRSILIGDLTEDIPCRYLSIPHTRQQQGDEYEQANFESSHG
jgi:hypothetical protein